MFGVGFGFGLSEWAQYVVFAAMFWSAGKIITKNITVVDGEPQFGINPVDVFTALFAIMFGAQQAGMAAAFGPDMGKAEAAAKRIFGIFEYPSAIDAIQIDSES